MNMTEFNADSSVKKVFIGTVKCFAVMGSVYEVCATNTSNFDNSLSHILSFYHV